MVALSLWNIKSHDILQCHNERAGKTLKMRCSQHHYKRSQHFTTTHSVEWTQRHLEDGRTGGWPFLSRMSTRVRCHWLRQGFGLSNTPAQQLCLSSIWLLEELGRDFHLAVVFLAAHSSRARAESAGGRCFEGPECSGFPSASSSVGPQSQPDCCWSELLLMWGCGTELEAALWTC